MKHIALIVVIVLAAARLPDVSGRPAAPDTVYFDDSDSTLMRLGNDYYELGLRKSNGSIAYITDKSTAQQVSAGSRDECLWGAYRLGDGTYIGGCSYNRAGANRFEYAWSPAARTLSLTYTPDPSAAQRVSVRASVTAADGPWFDLGLQLESHWGSTLDTVIFPADVVFLESDIQEVLLPALPGVLLGPGFFAENRSYGAWYPGPFFADYFALSSSRGRIALYSLHGGGPIRPVWMGVHHDDAYVPESTYYQHHFPAFIQDGQTWSAPRVRVRVSQPLAQTVAAYRADNGLDALPGLSGRLGARYAPLARAPLLKADAEHLGVPFSDYEQLLAQVPAPGLLHPVAYQPRGFDENQPDILPPDSRWGTTAEMAAMFRQMQTRGFIVMPYINPTWWDDESPTLQQLPAPVVITDVAVLDAQGRPRYESYVGRGGYIMSAYAPFVRQRLAALVDGVTAALPSDLVFEDQIGARYWMADFNASAPDPTAYSQGWWEHTRTYSPTLLMTEFGYDRLVETEIGFHGSTLLWDRRGYTTAWWGASNWRYYPFAPLLARDKVFFYQHDLAGETMTSNQPNFAWNLAFGYQLSYDLACAGGPDNPWLSVVSEFQQHVLARYAGERMIDFVDVQPGVTATQFENATAVVNWSMTAAYASGDYTLPPQGAMVASLDGTLRGGVFTRYNGVALGAGEHYLIEERSASTVVVHQPYQTAPGDTALAVARVPGWGPSAKIAAYAFTAAGEAIRSVPVSYDGQKAYFTYRQELAGRPVGYYLLLSRNSSSLLPVVVR